MFVSVVEITLYCIWSLILYFFNVFDINPSVVGVCGGNVGLVVECGVIVAVKVLVGLVMMVVVEFMVVVM